MTIAFHGNSQLQATALRQLNQHASAGNVQRSAFLWRDGKGSVVGCAIESDDLSDWTTKLGLPKYLALLIDAIASNQPSVEHAVDAGHRIIEAVPVGSNVNRVGSQFIIGLLTHGDASPELDALRKKAVSLQQKLLDGTPVEPAQWREARREAMATSDGLRTKSSEARLGQAAEASLWNPEGSPTAVVDVLRPWAALYGTRSLLDWGWTEADEENVHARLQEMHDRFLRDNPESKRTVFQHYAEEYPEEEARLRERMQKERSGVAEGYSAARDILLKILAE